MILHLTLTYPLFTFPSVRLSFFLTGMHTGTRQEEVIDHRLTDREWAEEWKHLDHVRKVITFFITILYSSVSVSRRDELSIHCRCIKLLYIMLCFKSLLQFKNHLCFFKHGTQRVTFLCFLYYLKKKFYRTA